MDSAEMQDGACFVEVTPGPLVLDKYVGLVGDGGAGAIATFVGVTRNSFQGKRTERLEYEAYVPMAAKKLLVSVVGRSRGVAGRQDSGSRLVVEGEGFLHPWQRPSQFVSQFDSLSL